MKRESERGREYSMKIQIQLVSPEQFTALLLGVGSNKLIAPFVARIQLLRVHLPHAFET